MHLGINHAWQQIYALCVNHSIGIGCGTDKLWLHRNDRAEPKLYIPRRKLPSR